MNKAIFLDRDGVINKNVKNLVKPEQFEFVDEERVCKAINIINDSGYLAIIITNQPIIAKGLMTFEDLDMIHERMKNLFAEHDVHIDDIFVCPHHPDKGFAGEIAELKIDCDCRKPKIGLFNEAIKKYDIDTKNSWMIGDSYADIVAGKDAGLKTIFLNTSAGSGSAAEKNIKSINPDHVTKDLLDAVEVIFGK